jgi:hypothetical protein
MRAEPFGLGDEVTGLHGELRGALHELRAALNRAKINVALHRMEVARRWTVLDACAAHRDRLESRVGRPGPPDSMT